MKWFEKTRAWVMKNFPSSEINADSSEAEVVNFLEENDRPTEAVELSDAVVSQINQSVQEVMGTNISEAIATHMTENPVEAMTAETVQGLITESLKPISKKIGETDIIVGKNKEEVFNAINDVKLKKTSSASAGEVDPPVEKTGAPVEGEDSTTISMNDFFTGNVVELQS